MKIKIHFLVTFFGLVFFSTVAYAQLVSPACILQRSMGTSGTSTRPHYSYIEFVNNCRRCVNIEIRQFESGVPKNGYSGGWTNVQPGGAKTGSMYVTQVGLTALYITNVSPCFGS